MRDQNGRIFQKLGPEFALTADFAILEDSAILVAHAGIHFCRQTNQSAVDGLGKRKTS